MKALRNKTWAKALAVILFVAGLYACLASAVGIAYLVRAGAYSQAQESAIVQSVQYAVLDSMLHQQNSNVAELYQNALEQGDTPTGETLSDAYQQRYGLGNYCFTLTVGQATSLESRNQGDTMRQTANTYRMELPESSDAVKKNVVRSYATEEERDQALNRLTEICHVDAAESSETLGTDGNVVYQLNVTYREIQTQTVVVTGGVRADLAAKDSFQLAAVWTTKLVEFRYGLIALCAAGGVLGLLCLVFLLYAAGHKKGVEGIALNWMDRIPFDLYLVLVLAAWGCTMSIFDNPGGLVFWILLAIFGAFWMLLGLSVLCTLAVRLKAKCLWHNTLLRRLCTLCRKSGGKLGHGAGTLFGKLPLFWKTGAVFVLLCFLEGLCILGIRDGGAFLWCLLKLAEAALLIWLVLSLRTLQKGGRELAGGNLDYLVPLDHLRWDLRRHGENLNHIRDGIQTAVEERIKSERLKTELITNVSHDIKTPLTSLVNYVDLLKKEHLSNEKAADYVEVLDRQSARLKKLIEDLVEASKASTGNVTVNWAKTDVNVLLAQSVGEYEEKLQNRQLALVLRQAPESPSISADGRLLWRVFDNLLSNIVKYAQPGTRVYLTSEKTGNRVRIIFRNISASPLNLTSEELLERFTRGDASRNTEGSGLGLSIAQSLTELQKGTFQIAVDGDLFKAILEFDCLS